MPVLLTLCLLQGESQTRVGPVAELAEQAPSLPGCRGSWRALGGVQGSQGSLDIPLAFSLGIQGHAVDPGNGQI